VNAGADGLASRRLALALLHRVLAKHQPFQDAWDAALADPLRRLSNLDPRDRAFVRLLVLTVLRRLRVLDRLIDARCERPNLAPPIRALLRLGAAQLVFLGTPAHAATATTMALAAREPKPQRAFINALLRRIALDSESIRGKPLDRDTLPDWLARSWTAAYGPERAAAIAMSLLAEPPLDLTPNAAHPDTAWQTALGGAPLPTGSIRCRHQGAIESIPGFAAGAWWVQDAAAALPAKLLVKSLAPKASVVDLCAAPGGKTMQLAAAGLLVTAIDRSSRRLATLAANLARTGLSATLVEADALTWKPERPADGVLLDAPCSATGTLRRHPDIAYLKDVEDVAAQAAQQRRFVMAAAGMLKAGGVLIYAVCSLQPEEGELIAEWVRRGGVDGLEPWPIKATEIGGDRDWRTAAGEVRTLPCHWRDRGGLDGFFVARFRRR